MKKTKKSKTKDVVVDRDRLDSNNSNNNDDVDDDDDGNIHDKRFQIAQTHPQFQKRHTKKQQNNNPSDDVQGNLLLFDNNNEINNIVDDRFKALYTDSRFAMGGDIGWKEGGVDKYGRKMKKKKEKKKEKIDSIDDNVNDNVDDNVDGNVDDDDDQSVSDSSRNSEKEEDEGEDIIKNDDPESRIAYLTALSRGEVDCSSTDSDSSSDDEDDNNVNSSDDESSSTSEDSIYGTAGVLDPSKKGEEEVEITYDKSRFMAVCNMDWTNVRAVDLLAVISSFSPPGAVKCVHVYPSDFGLQRMEKDKMFGPVGVWKKKKRQNNNNNVDVKEANHNDSSDSESSDNESNNSDNIDNTNDENTKNNSNDEAIDNNEESDSEEDEDGKEDNIDEKYQHFRENQDKVESDFDAEKLRAYEAAKLKYYFAVVEFTSVEASDIAYKELDGMEMGHSSSNIDFRSIPEGDIGDVIKGRECRDKASILPNNYSPPDFVVSALQQTAVKCTWEEGDRERDRMLTQYGVGNDTWDAMANGDDLRAYLASGKLHNIIYHILYYL